jgi:hypothetical protein
VAIDTSQPGSPGWWMNRLGMGLQREQRRFRILADYASGRPPLAWGSQDVRKGFYRFQKMSRTNFAEVIVEAPCMRVGLRSITTAVDNDADGDQTAWELITANDLEVALGTAVRLAKIFSRSYLATAHPDAEGEPAIITVEDPRQMITEADPVRPRRQRAALKVYYDAEAELDVAILWLPGQKWVATRERKGPLRIPRSGEILGIAEPVPVRFNPSSFEMRPERGDGDPEFGFYSETYDDPEIPIDIIENRRGVGEFELHTDLLDRINHIVLQRVVIATLQAFRQRALEQSESKDVAQLPEFDEAGNRIDYSDILESGPDAVWLLPPGAKLHEADQVDLQGILSAAKDDILHLSAVTFTPMTMFTPDAATQTAEGAQLSREGLVFKVEDFEKAAGRALARTIARAFRYMGDTQRGDAAKISAQWMPADRPSLAEMGSAASQVMGTLTWEQTQEIVWQRTPAQIVTAKAQRADDLILAQQQALLQAQKVNGAGQQG